MTVFTATNFVKMQGTLCELNISQQSTECAMEHSDAKMWVCVCIHLFSNIITWYNSLSTRYNMLLYNICTVVPTGYKYKNISTLGNTLKPVARAGLVLSPG